MRLHLLKTYLFIGLFTPLSCLSHPGGHGPVTEQQAIVIASDLAQQFVEFDAGLDFGKLSTSWLKLPQGDQRIHKRGEGYYIVALENRKEQRTLYLLMSIEGEVYDANFTGVFADLK